MMGAGTTLLETMLAIAMCGGKTIRSRPSRRIGPGHVDGRYTTTTSAKSIQVIDKAHCGHLPHNGHPLRSLLLQESAGQPRGVHRHRTVEPDGYKSRELKLKLKQVLDTPLDMLGLELTLSAEAANFDHREAKRRDLAVDLI